MSARYIEVEQIGSPIRCNRNQRKALIGLGLFKIGRIAWVPDTPASRGLIRKVAHLIRVNHDPAAPKAPRAPFVYDEAEDFKLMRELAFDRHGVVLELYEGAMLWKGKTPDFKLMKDGKLSGYCEMKSPRDDFILETPDPSGVAIRRNLPFYRKLGSHIRKAAAQFDAVNPDHALPNIMVFVSHTPDIERRDLRATIAGLPLDNGRWLPFLPRKLQIQVLDAARKIDLFLWIDAKERIMQHLTASDARHRKQALGLLDLSED